MSETVLTLGTSHTLIGVHTPARAFRGDCDDVPAVLLLTAGLVHRAGPFRLHTEVARHLSAAGYPCFRFDQAGIGDSEPRRDALGEHEGAARDIRLVMDELQSRHGVQRFVLFGLCSGADNLHGVAVGDPRVAGVIALDAFAYPTKQYYLRRYLRFLENPRHVLRSAPSKLRRLPVVRSLAATRRSQDRAEEQNEPGMFERAFPPRERIAGEMEAYLERGTRALYIYSGGYTYYNYAGQFFDNFPNLRGNSGVEVEFFGEADHTYLLRSDRARLIDRMAGWMQARFPCCTTNVIGSREFDDHPALCATATIR